MHQFYFRCLLALAMLVLFQPETFAQDSSKKVALTTFFVDRQIGMSELSSDVSAARNMLAMVNDSSFNLSSVLEEFKAKFFNDYAQHFPFTLKPEAEVLGNSDYQAFEESFDMSKPLTPKGYKVMYPGGFLQKKENRNQNEMLRIFPDADGVMYVFMHYGFIKKVAIGGMGTAGVRATCSMWLYNKEGKAVFRISESAVSKGTVALVAGIPVMGVDKVLPLCKDASVKLFEDLKGRLPKIAKKAAKKLN